MVRTITISDNQPRVLADLIFTAFYKANSLEEQKELLDLMEIIDNDNQWFDEMKRDFEFENK
jgi:hypothetical protein